MPPRCRSIVKAEPTSRRNRLQFGKVCGTVNMEVIMDKEKLAEIEKRMNEMTKGLKPTSDTPLYIPRIKYNPIPVDEDEA
jgi:hypothetical protein